MFLYVVWNVFPFCWHVVCVRPSMFVLAQHVSKTVCGDRVRVGGLERARSRRAAGVVKLPAQRQQGEDWIRFAELSFQFRKPSVII